YRPRIASQMIFERFDDETVAMNLESGAYHSLMGAAEDIFFLLAQGPTKAEIVSALGAKYAASDAALSDATATFMDSLVQAGLAEQEPLAISTEGQIALRRL